MPIGESPFFAPFGDYFTPEYAYIWKRDLPLIKDMGANVIRIYGWNNSNDHRQFLDEVKAQGLYVFLTFYTGTAKEAKVKTAADRQAAINNFAKQVWYYGDHPAILTWGFGNELNGLWNKYKDHLSEAFGCGWTQACEEKTGTGDPCYPKIQCVYQQLFSFIDAACAAIKTYTTRPCTTGFADVDQWANRINLFGANLSHVDIYSIQLYRGKSFGGFFLEYQSIASKPLLITEYGIDAYNDPCGWDENSNKNGTTCFNSQNDGNGGAVDTGTSFVGCTTSGACAKPGETVQADWDLTLSKEISDRFVLTNPTTGNRVATGGFLMAWVDEFWKNAKVQSHCESPCPVEDLFTCQTTDKALYYVNAAKGCNNKAHVTCGNFDAFYHDLCGYKLDSAPDNYVNEAWFGVTEPTQCDYYIYYHHVDQLALRPSYRALQTLWGGTTRNPSPTCAQLNPCFECLMSRMPILYLPGRGWNYDCNACQAACLAGPCTTGTLPVDLDECEENPCKHGVCVDGINSYQCFCPQGYYGVNCEFARFNGVACSANSQCVSNYCDLTAGECACNPVSACLPNGARCLEPLTDRCISGYCTPDGYCACPVGIGPITCTANGLSCTRDLECASGTCLATTHVCGCVVSAVVPSCAANGAVCPLGTSGMGCQSGFCADGVCCNAACAGKCQYCQGGGPAASISGQCAFVPSGYDPKADCGVCEQCNGAGSCTFAPAGSFGSTPSALAGYPNSSTYTSSQVCANQTTAPALCGFDGACDGQGECRFHSASVECQAEHCAEALWQKQAFCTGNGFCAASSQLCPRAYRCDPVGNLTCASSCSPAGSQVAPSCAEGYYCSANATCLALLPQNHSCLHAYECTSGHCVDGVCCATACVDKCYSCSLTHDGVCNLVPQGQDPHGDCTANISVCSIGECKRLDNRSCTNSSECLSELCYEAHCLADPDQCLEQPCQNGGNCTDLIKNYSCSCVAGYNGKDCEHIIDMCASKPCVHGTCTGLVNAFVCNCSRGYSGPLCAVDIDECASKPCQNNATCTDLVAGVKCSCTPNFRGDRCELAIDFCSPNPCFNGGQCRNGSDQQRCLCGELFDPLTNCETAFGLSTGAVAGIVVASIIGLALIALTFFYFIRKWRREKEFDVMLTNRTPQADWKYRQL